MIRKTICFVTASATNVPRMRAHKYSKAVLGNRACHKSPAICRRCQYGGAEPGEGGGDRPVPMNIYRESYVSGCALPRRERAYPNSKKRSLTGGKEPREGA